MPDFLGYLKSWFWPNTQWAPGTAPNPYAIPSDPSATDGSASDPYHDGQWSPLIAPVASHPDADQIRADAYVAPYTGPLDLDDYGRETDAMRRAYRDVHRSEPAIRSAIDGKAAAVAALDVSVLPEDKDHPEDCKAARFVDWTVSRSPHGWDGLILTVLRPALIDGFSIAEKVLKGVDDSAVWRGYHGLRHVKGRDTAHLLLRLDGFRNVLGIVNTVRGLRTFSPAKVILFTHAELFDNPFGQSDLRAAYRSAGLIADAYKLWYLALKRCGEPYLHGKVDAPTHRKDLEAALRGLRASGWAVTSGKDEIALLDLAGAASFDAFERKVRILREDIFLAVRGAYTPFMHSTSGKGEARGSAAVSQHGGSDPVEEVLARAVGRCLTEQLIPDLVRPNFGAGVGLPRVVLGGVNWGEMRTRLDILERAKQLGLSVSAKWAHETLQIPPAATPDDELGGPGKGGDEPGDGEAGPGAPRTFAESHFSGWDRSHLVLKEVVDKNGKRTHVWVNPGTGAEEPDADAPTYTKPPAWFDSLKKKLPDGTVGVLYRDWYPLFKDVKTPRGVWSPEEVFDSLADGDGGIITEDTLRAAYRKNGKYIKDRLARADELFDGVKRRSGTGPAPADPVSGTPGVPPNTSSGRSGPTPPASEPPLAAGDYRAYTDLARKIVAQHFNHSVAEAFVAARKADPLYKSDSEFKELVDRLAARVADAKIGGLSAATAKLLVGGAAPNPDYLARHPDTPAAIQEIDKLRAKALGEFGRKSWEEDVRKLQGEIGLRRYQAEIPRVYRYTAGILMGGAKTANGLVEATAHFDKIPGGLWDLATDKKTQIAAVKALVAKLSDPSADNLGELTVEIPLTVSGTTGAVKGTAQAAIYAGKLVVKVPRATVELWKRLRPAAGELALDVKPGGLYTSSTGLGYPGKLNEPFAGSYEELTREINKLHPQIDFKGFVENAKLPGEQIARWNELTKQIEFAMPLKDVPRALVAEEVQHALDTATGWTAADTNAAWLKEAGSKGYTSVPWFEKDNVNRWHHRRVFTRILQAADRGDNSVMNLILGKADVPDIYEWYKNFTFRPGDKPPADIDVLLNSKYQNHYHAK